MKYLLGIRPTGNLHIGHFFSVIYSAINILNSNSNAMLDILIADLHAYFSLGSSNKAIANVNTVISELEFFFDKKVNIYIQSNHNKKISLLDKEMNLLELFIFLSSISKSEYMFNNKIIKYIIINNITDFIMNNNCEEFFTKFSDIILYDDSIIYGNISEDKIKSIIKHFNLSENDIKHLNTLVKYINSIRGIHGIFNYPILMTADIMIFDSDYVILGYDQQINYNIYYEIAKYVKNNFNSNIKITQPYILNDFIIYGHDNRKMSKSFNNCLYLKDCNKYENVESFFLKMINYPRKKNEPGIFEKCAVSSFINILGLNDIYELCINGNITCQSCKKSVAKEVFNLISQYIN